jgi:hypothetical protein
MKAKITIAVSCASLLCLVALNGALASDDPTDPPIGRLRQVRSLRCTYDTEATTAFKPEGRKIVTDHDVMVVIYDNIDLGRGTARVVYVKGVAPGAGDVTVRWNGNALWFTEIPQSNAAVSNAILTTVFARYAEGTKDFIALDSRHSLSVIVAGSMSSGTCTELH